MLIEFMVVAFIRGFGDFSPVWASVFSAIPRAILRFRVLCSLEK